MKLRHIGVSVGTVLAVVIGGAALSQSAQATSPTEPEVDAQLVTPEVEIGTNDFFTLDQIEGVWDAVTGSYPAVLPSGYSFPVDAPDVFYPEDDPNPLFQTGLPDMVAAQYWRCSWLDAYLNVPGSSVVEADLEQSLELYWSLPSVEAYDLTGYTPELLDEIGAELGYPTRHHTLFAFDCEGYTHA